MRASLSLGAALRLALLVALVAGAVTAAVVLGLPSVSELRTYAGSDPLDVVLLSAGFAVATLAPVPKNVLVLSAGLLLELPVALVVAFSGALLGAVVAFAIGRLLGRDAVSALAGRRLTRLDAMATDHGLATVLGARLAPALPFTIFNYTAGMSGMRLRDFVLGTLLGIVPGTVFYVVVGASGATPGRWPQIGRAHV